MKTSSPAQYTSEMFGSYSPYLNLQTGEIFETFPEAVASLNKRVLDCTAILSQINFNYVLGDRTLLQGLSRFPWHSSLTASGQIERHAPFPHGREVVSEKEIAIKYDELLSEYVESITQKHQVIWITLSGGYDSRVVAGVLQKFTSNHDVRVLNWGHKDSRDVHYAREIADHYGWQFNLIPYDPEKNIDAIHYAIDHSGAEISPIDYNPLEYNKEIISRFSNDHAILFAHYGDGIGRAHYSHRHINDIKELPIRNPYFIFNTNSFGDAAVTLKADRALAWSSDQSPPDTRAKTELDMNENYLRRLLTKRFEFCKKYDPFAYPPLAKYAYSLDFSCRTDDVYRHLLYRLDPYLHDYPWARTGKSFSGRVDTSGLDASQHTKHKDYLMLRENFEDTLLNGELSGKNVINSMALKVALSAWPQDLTLSTLLAKLYSVELMAKKYDVEIPTHENTFLSSFKGSLGSRAYAMAKKLRR